MQKNKMSPSLSTEVIVESTGHYGYPKNFRTAFPQLIAVSVKNLLLLSYGMTLGFPTLLIPAVSNPVPEEPLHLQQSQLSWISSINLIVVPVGCALSGLITNPLGRRRSMQIVNFPFCIAWLLFHFSTTTAELYGALSITGLAGGVLEAPVLTYVAEVTLPYLRGALTATSSMCIILGVFTQFLLGTFYYWRTVALINIIFTVLAFIALCFVPESPHWLVSRHRYEEAQASLQWLRGWTTPNNVQDELQDIKALFKNNNAATDMDEEETFSDQVKNYTKRSFLIPFFLVSYCFFVGHFCGMTTLQTYAITIFQMLKSPIDKYYATLILGVVQIFGSAICVSLVHYVGKRPLVLVSTTGAAVCCFLVSGYDFNLQMHNENLLVEPINSTTHNNSTLPGEDGVQNATYNWMPMVFLMLLAAFTHIGIRLLPWILIGEVFTAKTRSGAAGLSSAVGYIFGFLTNKLFLKMVASLSIWGTYGFYGIVSLSGTVVLFFILPETEGKKLIDIENHFAGIARLTNKVYRSKIVSRKGAIVMDKITLDSKPSGGTTKPSGGTTNPNFVLESSSL